MNEFKKIEITIFNSFIHSLYCKIYILGDVNINNIVNSIFPDTILERNPKKSDNLINDRENNTDSNSILEYGRKNNVIET